MNVWFATMTAVALVSVISVTGIITLAVNRRWLKRLTLLLVSFAVGALLGDAFLHLLPEAYGHFGFTIGAAVYVLVGLFAFFALEKFLRWRHCHDVACEFHMGERATADGRLHPVVKMVLVGDAAHNFLDGMVLAAAWVAAPPVGLATTVAIILHEIPQEFGDFGVLIFGGLSVRRALAYNFLSALGAFAGAAAVLVAGRYVAGLAPLLVPLTAGGFIYIAGADLIPELQHDVGLGKALVQIFAAAAGIAVMVGLAAYE